MEMKTYGRRLSELRSPIVSDVLDKIGVEGAIPGLIPVFDQAVAVGRAMPVPVRSRPNAPKGLREGLMEAIDLSARGTVLVVSSDTQACTAWGGLVSRYAKLSGIAGAVVCGATRDTEETAALRLPVFASAVTPRSGYNRVEVLSPGTPIRCGSITVQKDDLVVADRDGVVVVPSALIPEVLDTAFSFLAKEGNHIADMRKRLKRQRQSRSR
jgi:regulator of RNase E activity RraA